jgi:hypothetical protein
MNIASLIEIARRDYLNDTTTPGQTWDDAWFLRNFSEAQRQACNRTDFIFTDSLFLTLAADTGSYVLPINLTRLLFLTFEGRELKKVFVEQLPEDWRTRSGFSENTNRNYIVRGSLVTFTPKPDAIDTGLKVCIEGFIYPSADFTTTADTPVIPIEYHEKLVHWVCHKAYSNEVASDEHMAVKDERKAAEHLTLFNQAFGKPVSAPVRQHQFETNQR